MYRSTDYNNYVIGGSVVLFGEKSVLKLSVVAKIVRVINSSESLMAQLTHASICHA
jgi:hypothetical protein